MAKKKIRKICKKAAKKLTQKQIKKKLPNVDGLGPKDLYRIRIALRKVWSWNYGRKLCIERATGKDGFPVCERCETKVPKVFPDHINKVGDVDDGFIKRLFISSKDLQALCRKCHNEKTAAERRLDRKKLQVTFHNDTIGDFY